MIEILQDRFQFLTFKTDEVLKEDTFYYLKFVRNWACETELVAVKVFNICDCEYTFRISIMCDGSGDVSLACGRYCVELRTAEGVVLDQKDAIVSNIEDMSLTTNCGAGQIVTDCGSSSNVDFGCFSTSYALPPGCSLVSESLTFVFEGQTFGPFVNPTFPFNFGPTVGGANPGITFLVSNGIRNFTVAPTTPLTTYPATIETTYLATGDNCGVDQSTCQADILAPPTRAYVNSDDTTAAAIIISTGGSLASDGVTNIADDPTATYTDEFNLGACGMESAELFTITGNAGVAISGALFSDWNPALNATAQANIIAAFSGQIGDAGGLGGYTFDKEIVRDELVAAGILNPLGQADGAEWCVHGDVTHNGATSNEAQYQIQRFCDTQAAFAFVPGLTGPFDPAGIARIGAFGYNLDNSTITTGNATGLTDTNFLNLYASGAFIGANHQFQTVLNIETYVNPAAPGQNAIAFNNFNEVYYQGAYAEHINGLQSFGMTWRVIHEEADPAQPDDAESLRPQGIVPTWWQDLSTATVCDLRWRGGADRVTPPVPTTPLTVSLDSLEHADITIAAQRFPIGTPGINVVGTENPDPALTPTDPLDAEFAAGGVAQAVVIEAAAGAWLFRIQPTVSGDYYWRMTTTGTVSGLPYVMMGSERFKII